MCCCYTIVAGRTRTMEVLALEYRRLLYWVIC
jgi:hypothetical protein